MSSNNPILNNPYIQPSSYYDLDSDGNLDYDKILEGRRKYIPVTPTIPNHSKEKTLYSIEDINRDVDLHLINLIRNEISLWRLEEYPNTTRVSKELLYHWFLDDSRHYSRRLFFAQREAIETAIWLNEIASKSNAGQNILNLLANANSSVSNKDAEVLPRIAFKMATGTGKTVVMAAFILYHFLNRKEYFQDQRFADYFLLVAPGITIRDRLGVLIIDTSSSRRLDRNDYYSQRDLIPKKFEDQVGDLNTRISIINYHAFEPKNLVGNKKSPMDGKIGKDGKKVEGKEDYSLVFKRLFPNFKAKKRLLVLNDEAHHAYLPKSSGKTEDGEDEDENEKAAVWYRGLLELKKRYIVQQVYDLSATPYFLSGSGYEPYSLFPWVVSDFGLIEAIESGLVKIPFLPVSDNSQALAEPQLRNIYEQVRDDLPKKGQRTKKKESKENSEDVDEKPPQIPELVKIAFDQFQDHYKNYYDGYRERQENKKDLFSPPPVLIIVCNNTTTSKEFFKLIAGYEYTRPDGEIQIINGAYELFSNFDNASNKPKSKSPTLLIDSSALENSEQIDSDFKKIFEPELEEFRKDYARLNGQGSLEKLSDGEILREVVNTVGKQGKLGAHIRCVVSVSMLTEGWDANTVTHIMGLRAFRSQLLCEQVAGRALRRMNYFLQGYDKDGNPTNDKRKIAIEKFPPEYAHIIGIPFNLFRKGTDTGGGDPPEWKDIYAIEDRKNLEISFPNVVGYRMENVRTNLEMDFSEVGNFEIPCSSYPLETTTKAVIGDEEVELKVSSVFEKRDQEILFHLTKNLIKKHFSDYERAPQIQFFGRLKEIVSYWYENKIRLVGESDLKYKKLLIFMNQNSISDHIRMGINPQLNTEEFIRPIINFYNPTGSTTYVKDRTSKEIYKVKKSHINAVIMDSGWEGIAAKTLEAIPAVESFVKNQFLGFKIPYVKDGKDRDYFPDFIVKYKKPDGSNNFLILEITGFNKDKTEKKFYVENRWLPAMRSISKDKDFGNWEFLEVTDIEDIKNILNQHFSGLSNG